MPLTENGIQYLSATEASIELNISRTYFYKEIRPLLSTHKIENRKWDYYKAEDVRRVKKRIVKLSPKPAVSHVIGAKLVQMQPGDMVRVASVLAEHWGYPNIERWTSLIERNSEIGYMLVSSEEKVVGCGFLFPHTEQKILDILVQEVTPPTQLEEILLYGPEKSCYLYARTLCVTKEGTITQRRYWGAFLIRNLIRTVEGLGDRGIVVRKIYARSDTREGEKLMRDMGFCQLRTTTGHKNFVIDFETSGLDTVLRYEKALNQWRLRHGGEGI